MQLKKGLKKSRKSFILYLAVMLFVLNLSTETVHAASAAGRYGTAEMPVGAEISGEYGHFSDPDQEDFEISLETSQEILPAAEEWEETPNETESSASKDTELSEETFEGTELFTETEMPAETPEETHTDAENAQETETFPETEETPGAEESGTEKITELSSESGETLPETELSSETGTDDMEETISPAESEPPESESPETETETETEELSLKDHSALFELLQEWWKSMEMAFITKILQLILAFVLFFAGRRIINSIIRLMDRIAAAKGWDPTVCSFARNAARAVLYLALVMSILTCVGVEVASLAAIISSIGVALGLALQGSLSNLAGGLLLAIMKPLHLGDFISAAGYSGTVREIGLVYTTLVGADDRTVIIPNSTLMSSVIENYSEQTTRRVEVQCSISYDADLKKAMDIFRDVLESIPERLPDKPVNVFVASLADSGVVLEGQIYVQWTQYLTALWAVREKIKLSYDKAGIEIPLPQIVVSRKQENLK